MTMYATLEEAIDAAREEFLADNPGIDAENASYIICPPCCRAGELYVQPASSPA
ncbi:hypothetical protein ESCOCP334B_15620 [Escherichia coli]